MTPDTQSRTRFRPDKQRLAAYRAFITAHAEIITHIERDLAAAKVIPVTWYDVLIELYEAPDRRLRLHELARAVVLSRSTLTRTIDRLAAARLLRREPDPSDGRGAFAVLTDEGFEALRQAWPVYAQGIVEYFARHLTDEEARLMTMVCERIRDSARDT